jgi:lipoprotein-anchoring transpeptidase ErfK/SrfK
MTDRISTTNRRKFLGLALAAGAAFIPMPALPAEAMAKTQIWDSKARKWVNYDSKKARQYYVRNKKQAPEAFRMHTVTFRTAEKPGTIIIDGNQHYLYLVQPNKQAIRYGIGVGRDGFGWAGIVRIGRMSEKWPTWTPPAEMVARDEKARKWAGGMPGGPDNPLGAFALYLYEGDRDTITVFTAPRSLGRSGSTFHLAASACATRISSTCIRASRSEPKSLC